MPGQIIEHKTEAAPKSDEDERSEAQRVATLQAQLVQLQVQLMELESAQAS